MLYKTQLKLLYTVDVICYTCAFNAHSLGTGGPRSKEKNMSFLCPEEQQYGHSYLSLMFEHDNYK